MRTGPSPREGLHLAPSGGPGMSAIPPLLEEKQTSGEGAKMTHMQHGRIGAAGRAAGVL